MRPDLRHALAVSVALVASVSAALAGCAAPPTARVAVLSDSHAFSPEAIEAPAGEPFTLVYTNDEEWAEHNIAVYSRVGGEAIAVSESIVGPDAVTELVVPALAPGTYHLQCDIHPFMNGRLVIQGG
jgi:plastocyanin